MIQHRTPAALAKPVLVGSYTSNFADAMLKFSAASAIIELEGPIALRPVIDQLLTDPAKRQSLGQRAQDVVRKEKGVTARYAKEILALLDRCPIGMESELRMNADCTDQVNS